MKKFIITLAFALMVFVPCVKADGEFGTVSTITTGGNVENAQSANVVATYDSGTLNVDPIDGAIGRNEEGAWVGVKVTAPYTDKARLEKSKFRTIQSDGSLSEVKDFWMKKDDKEAGDGNHYIQLWALVNNRTLTAAVKHDAYITASWIFDWNNDGVYEQTITVKINPANITVTDAVAEGSVDNSWDSSKYDAEKAKYYYLTLKPAGATTTAVTVSKLGIKKESTPKADLENYLNDIKTKLAGTNIEVIGIYEDKNGTKEFDQTQTLNDNKIVYVVLKTKTSSTTPTEPAKPDTTVTVEKSENLNQILKDSLKESLGDKYNYDDVNITVQALETKKENEKIKEEVKKKLPDAKIVKYLDINVEVTSKTNEHLDYITELTKEIKLSVEIPKDLPAIADGYTRQYYIIRQHGDEITIINPSISKDGKTLTFSSDKFSTYALAYTDNKIAPEKNKADAKNPNTSDNIYMILTMLGISVAGSIIVIKKTLFN